MDGDVVVLFNVCFDLFFRCVGCDVVNEDVGMECWLACGADVGVVQ